MIFLGCFMAEFLYDYLEILKQHSEAIVVENGGGYIFANEAARKVLDGGDGLLPFSKWVPEAVWASESTGASGTATLDGRSYSVHMSRLNDYRIFSIIPARDDEKDNFEMFALLNESIKTPLAMISAAANAMLPLIEGSGSEVLSNNLSVIYKNYYKLIRISNALSGYYELKTQSAKLNLNCVDLISLCKNLINTVSLLTKERGVRIWFNTSLDSAKTEADFDKLEYVLLNILSNCLKYAGTGDDITVHLSSSKDFFVITVSFSSTAIPDQLLQKVFEPGLRFKSLDDSFNTLGAGLAYSSYIIEAHGGSMIVESRAGRSTTIKFTVPKRSADKFSESPVRYGEGGMTPILTELSDILSLDCYGAKYLD